MQRADTPANDRFQRPERTAASGLEQSEASLGAPTLEREVPGAFSLAPPCAPTWGSHCSARQRNKSQIPSCTRTAHAALQSIDIKNESFRSIMGATHNRCDNSFIRLKFSMLGRSRKLLDRLVILSSCEHDRVRSSTAWYSQIRNGVGLRALLVHT